MLLFIHIRLNIAILKSIKNIRIGMIIDALPANQTPACQLIASVFAGWAINIKVPITDIFLPKRMFRKIKTKIPFNI